MMNHEMPELTLEITQSSLTRLVEDILLTQGTKLNHHQERQISHFIAQNKLPEMVEYLSTLHTPDLFSITDSYGADDGK